MRLLFFRIYLSLAALLLMGASVVAQQPLSQFFDLTGTGGEAQGAIAGAYVHNFKLGKAGRFEIGPGIRLTSYFGEKKDFITAPARLARTNTIPFLIVFAGQNTMNWDTLTVQRPFLNALNLTANLGYAFSHKWSGGLNIDLIGITVGRKTSGILVSNGNTTTEPKARPTTFNVLLTGDLDHGSLNSEFFLKYQLNKRWQLKAVYQFLFTEYKISSIKQTAPDGTGVYRFRNKANNLGAGISYHLFKKK